VPGLDAFRLRTTLEDFFVRIDRAGGPPNAEQRGLAGRMLSELRFAVEGRNPRALRAVQRIVNALDSGGGFELLALREPGAALQDAGFETQLLRRLEEELERGRLVVEREQLASLEERDTFDPPELPPLPPARRDSGTHTFEVRFIDEIGVAIGGVDAEFTADGAKTRSTNAAGIALLEGISTTSANVALLDAEALGKVLDARWDRFRQGAPPKESNTREVTFQGGELGPFDLKAEILHTVVVKPPLGKIDLELLDKTGSVRHSGRGYQLTGPQSFSGTTDDEGRLRHDPVFPGDYTLTLTVDEDVYETPVDVLDPAETAPQVRFIGAVPRAVLARLKGGFFEKNKSFLLPVVVARFKYIREVYANNNPSELLIVGHTDTTAQPSINDPLALERADCTAAYLLDDVDAWLKMYGGGTPEARRWSNREDLLMVESMPDFGTKPASEDSIRWYQRTRGLKVDGIAGNATRTKLVGEYMRRDGSPLTDEPNFDITITTHGCGENFPLDESGDELDAAPADQKDDAPDRRVELFFFDAEFGIQPPPPGKTSKKGSSEYPAWRKAAVLAHELDAEQAQGLVLEWLDALDDELPDDLEITASQAGIEQSRQWADADVDGDYRRFVFDGIGGNEAITLSAASTELDVTLTLWDQQLVGDPDNPPTWTHWLEEMVGVKSPDGSLQASGAVPPVSDLEDKPDDTGEELFA